MDRDVKIELVNIVETIEGIDNDIKVIGVTGFRNPRYLAFYFKNREESDKIFANFKMLNDSYVVYLAWAFDVGVNATMLKVHWLPITLDLEIIKKNLSKYVKCVEAQRESLAFMSGREMPLGKITFTVTVNEGVAVEDVPHIMKIENLEALITIPGRSPLCLNCEVMGHISKNCKLRYCTVCGSLKPKEHQCDSAANIRSFADAVKRKDSVDDRIDENDLAAAIEVSSASLPLIKQKVISEKIIEIEKQIQNLDAMKPTLVTEKPDMKRKAITLADGAKDKLSESSNNEDITDDEADGGAMTVSEGSMSSKDGDEVSINIDDTQFLPGVSVIKKKNRTRRRNKKRTLEQNPCVSVNSTDMNDSETINRSYGKPVYNNRRRIKEHEAFDKAFNTREFIFED